MTDRHGSRWLNPAWFLFWALASSAWCLSAAQQLSSTFDEPFYLENGLHAWRTGSYHALLRVGTMPLPMSVETLPVYVWEVCRGRQFDATADFDRILPVARAGNLVFWWLLLFYGWRFGRLYGGDWGGRLAVLLLACEPNLLAHACLASTDIAASGCLLGFVYHYQTRHGGGWWRRVGTPGVWYGLAMLAKASALAFGPVAMFALDHLRRWHIVTGDCPPETSIVARVRAYLRQARFFPEDFWKVSGVGLLLTFVYSSTDWQSERSFVAFAEVLPNPKARAVITPVAENLRVFPNAGSGLVYQIKHNIRGHEGAYLLGRWYHRSVPYYFPVALLIKLTLPMLIGMIVLLLARPRALLTPLGLLLAVLLVFSLSCRVQIGVRLIFPLVCFWLLVIAVGLARVLPALPRRAPAFAAAALAALLVVSPLSVWPDGLRYANQAWGGPGRGYRLLSDSNYDWGQGLKELAAWKHEKGDPPLKVWYYGKEPGFLHSPEHCPIHNMPVASTEDVERILGGSYFAVSTSLMYRDPNFTPASERVFAVLKGMHPVARTRTYFIYDFTGEGRTVRK
jgi:hypothetical protein